MDLGFKTLDYSADLYSGRRCQGQNHLGRWFSSTRWLKYVGNNGVASQVQAQVSDRGYKCCIVYVLPSTKSFYPSIRAVMASNCKKTGSARLRSVIFAVLTLPLNGTNTNVPMSLTNGSQLFMVVHSYQGS